MIIVSALIIGGFLLSSLISYSLSAAALRKTILTYDLPLTSDNIFSSLQQDILKPIYVSKVMAVDTFLQDWVAAGEKNESLIRNYLKEVQREFKAYSSFFVSENSRIYYHYDGVLKQVQRGEERDSWYFRVKAMTNDYEVNIDPDMANQDKLTVFVNHKVHDKKNRFIGAIGLGITLDAIQQWISYYQEKNQCNMYLLDSQGSFIIKAADFQYDQTSILQDLQIKDSLADFLAGTQNQFSFRRNGKTVHLLKKYIPDLDWYLVVEKGDGMLFQRVQNNLWFSLLSALIITVLVVVFSFVTINSYQRRIKLLNGLIPICSNCKKIRDDKGYWSQVEHYIMEHSDAEFTHGICPDCLSKYYPAYDPGEKKVE